MITLLIEAIPERDFDALEINPCRTLHDVAIVESRKDVVEQCDREDAEFWSVYVHYINSGLECIADCDYETEAKSLVKFLTEFRSRFQLRQDLLCKEAVADIAYIAGGKRHYSGDSREDISSYIKWAEKFELDHEDDGRGNETYDGKDYLTAIEEFALQKLKEAGNCEVERGAIAASVKKKGNL